MKSYKYSDKVLDDYSYKMLIQNMVEEINNFIKDINSSISFLLILNI